MTTITPYPQEAFTTPIRRFKRMAEVTAYIESLNLDPSTLGTLPIFGVDASSTSGAKKYIVGGFEPLWKHIERLTTQQKGHFYEVLQANVPLRLYFDIDRPAPCATFDSDVQQIIASVKRCYQSYISSDASHIRLDPVILDASTPAKHSRHLIFEDLVFENMERLKIFVDLVTVDLLNEHPLRKEEGNHIMGIDPAVYTKARLFRVLGSSKKNKKPHTPFNLVLSSTDAKEDGFVASVFFRTLITPFRTSSSSTPSSLQCIPILHSLAHIKRPRSPSSERRSDDDSTEHFTTILKRAKQRAGTTYECGPETIKYTTSEWEALLQRAQRCLSRRHPTIRTFYSERQGDTLEFVLSPGIPCPNNGDVAHRSNKTWFKVNLKTFWGGYTCCDPSCSHHSWGRKRYRDMVVNSFALPPQKSNSKK